jgi:hypothetical protein
MLKDGRIQERSGFEAYPASSFRKNAAAWTPHSRQQFIHHSDIRHRLHDDLGPTHVEAT